MSDTEFPYNRRIDIVREIPSDVDYLAHPYMGTVMRPTTPFIDLDIIMAFWGFKPQCISFYEDDETLVLYF